MIFVLNGTVAETDPTGEFELSEGLNARALTIDEISSDVHLSKIITQDVLDQTNEEIVGVGKEKEFFINSKYELESTKIGSLNYDIVRVDKEELGKLRKTEHSLMRRKVKDKIFKISSETKTTVNEILSKLKRHTFVKENNRFNVEYFKYMNDNIYSIYSTCRGSLTFGQLVNNHIFSSDIISVVEFDMQRGGGVLIDTTVAFGEFRENGNIHLRLICGYLRNGLYGECVRNMIQWGIDNGKKTISVVANDLDTVKYLQGLGFEHYISDDVCHQRRGLHGLQTTEGSIQQYFMSICLGNSNEMSRNELDSAFESEGLEEHHNKLLDGADLYRQVQYISSKLENDTNRQGRIMNEADASGNILMLSPIQEEYVQKILELNQGMNDIDIRIHDLRNLSLEGRKRRAHIVKLKDDTSFIMSKMKVEHIDIQQKKSEFPIVFLYRIYTACRERYGFYNVSEFLNWDFLTVVYIGDNVESGHILGSAVSSKTDSSITANVQCASHTPYIFKYTLEKVESHAKTQFDCECIDHSCSICANVVVNVQPENDSMVRLYGMNGYQLDAGKEGDNIFMSKGLFIVDLDSGVVNVPHELYPTGKNMSNYNQTGYYSEDYPEELIDAIDHLDRKFMEGFETRLMVTVLKPQAGIAKKRKNMD